MIKNMRFHHIGVVVNDIDATAMVYEQGGYTRSATIFDPIQDVNICWLTKDQMPTIELLAPVDNLSPVCRTLEKNGVTIYHCCYVVESIEDTISKLRTQRYVLTSRPVEAVAFCGSRVCFLYNRYVGLIELVEEPANIIE